MSSNKSCNHEKLYFHSREIMYKTHNQKPAIPRMKLFYSLISAIQRKRQRLSMDRCIRNKTMYLKPQGVIVA